VVLHVSCFGGRFMSRLHTSVANITPAVHAGLKTWCFCCFMGPFWVPVAPWLVLVWLLDSCRQGSPLPGFVMLTLRRQMHSTGFI